LLFCPFDPFFFDLWAKEKGERKKKKKEEKEVCTGCRMESDGFIES